MLKTRKRWISLLVTLAMLVAFVVPFAGPAAAGAASYNTITTIPQFDSSGATDKQTATLQVKIDPPLASESSARIEVLASDGKQLTINSITSAADAVYATAQVVYGSSGTTVDFNTKNTTVNINDKSFTLKVTPNGTNAAKVTFYLNINADGAAAGDIKVNIFNTTNQFDPGSVVVARASGSAVTAALVGSAPSIGADLAAKSVTIRFQENAANALKKGTDTVKIKLPVGFEWIRVTTDFDYISNDGPKGTVSNPDARTLAVTIDTPSDIPYALDITAKVGVKDADTAKMGEVVASIEGNNGTSISPSELTVANYADYGFDVSVASVKNVLAGKNDQKLDTIKIEEKIPGSFITGRKVTVKFPEWVKISDFEQVSSNFSYDKSTIDGKSNKFTFTPLGNAGESKAKLEFKLKLNIEAYHEGDLVATISGAGVPETDVVVAKVNTPVSASATPADVKIGVQDQAAPDVTITEVQAGAVAQKVYDMRIVLPAGAKFAATPKVEVISGDLELKTDLVRVDGGVLYIPVKSESVKASTIKISGIKVTLDRTVPEGPLTAKIVGDPVVENYGTADNQFRTEYATKFTLANCVTPAPFEQKGTAVFKIGEKKYIVNGQEVEMDVAPIAEAGRTYLPARFVANAMGVPDANILWDQASKTVTVIRGERFVQMKVGSKQILVNGITLNMDVAPKVVPGRVLIPFRFLAQALGAEVVWDPADPNTIILNF